MAKFISVLDSQLNDPIWTAVQWADTKSDLQGNKFYTAGVNLSLPKNQDDQAVGSKTITEVSTGAPASCTMIKLAQDSANSIRLSATTASDAFLKKIEKTLSSNL